MTVRPWPVSDRRLLVTGGAGFLGVHLVRGLLARGARVVVLDDDSAPSPLGLDACPALELRHGDVRDAAAVSRSVQGCDHVVHLASVVGVEAVLADPERTDSVIREGSACVWEHARAARLPFLFLSSSEVTDPARVGPRSVYARAKRSVERALLASPDAGLATIVRPFNVVGPGQTAPGMVLPALLRAARAGLPLPVHVDGRQQRGFLHVSDFTEVLLDLLEAHPRSGGQVLEIGSPERTSIAELAERLGRLSGQLRVACHAPQPSQREDRPRRAPRLEALRRLVPFAPKRALDDILDEVWSHA
jgi:nucleoside-diphosphate-sugar epimerase